VPMGYADQLHAAVAQQPVAVAIGTRDSRGFQHYSGGVFDGSLTGETAVTSAWPVPNRMAMVSAASNCTQAIP